MTMWRPSPRFVTFVLVGGFCSFVNLVARFLIDRFTSLEVAIVLAFTIALTTAFFLNRLFVFKEAAGGWAAQYGRFALVNLLTLVQIFAITELLARLVLPAIDMRFYPDTVAHAIALLSPLLTSYWAHQRFSFRADPTPASVQP